MYQRHHYRSLSGILALRKKYGDDAVDRACVRTCHYGNILSEMMDDLYMSRTDNSFRQKLKKYVAPDFLIINEFGLKKLEQTNVDGLYEMISKRSKPLPPL